MTIREQVRGYRRAAGLSLWTTAMLTGVQAHSGLHGDPQVKRQVFRRWEQLWAERLLWWFGVRLHEVGREPSPSPRGRLVVANHRSPIDILIILSRIGGCLLSRADVAEWPLLGKAAQAAGTIFVDRDQRTSGAQAIREMRRRLNEGEQVVVFPEGATSAGDVVQPFRRGAFTAAAGLPLEVLPLAFAYPPGCEFLEDDFGAHLLRVAGRARTHVGVAIGEPYQLTGSSKVAAAQAQQVVQELAVRARAAVDSHQRGGSAG